MDAGETWEVVYESSRSYELLWKMSFPSKQIGYATLQSMIPTQRNGTICAQDDRWRRSWSELPLTSEFKVREFGIGFVDESIGWVGAVPHGFQTINGGQTWESVDLGNAVNKIRILDTPNATVGFAIGTHVYRIDIPRSDGLHGSSACYNSRSFIAIE